jgi:hypothetical protein
MGINEQMQRLLKAKKDLSLDMHLDNSDNLALSEEFQLFLATVPLEQVIAPEVLAQVRAAGYSDEEIRQSLLGVPPPEKK